MAPRIINRTQDLTTARADEYVSFNPCDVCYLLLLTIVVFCLVLILLLTDNITYSIFFLIFINFVIYQVIRAGSYGIAMLRNEYCSDLQNKQPFVLFKAESTVPIEGTAGEVRTDPNMWYVSHLNARNAFKYLSKYKNIRNGEPNRKWKSTLHRGMSGGTVSMHQIQPILSLSEWNSRNSTRIRSLELKLAIFLLEKADETLANITRDGSSLAQEVQVCLFLGDSVFVS